MRRSDRARRGMSVTDEELHNIVKNELGNRGYVVNVEAHREGDYLVGKLHVTSAETDETVAKIVGVGNMEGMRLCFGVDAEGTLRDVVTRALTTWQGVQTLMPTFVVKPAAKP